MAFLTRVREGRPMCGMNGRTDESTVSKFGLMINALNFSLKNQLIKHEARTDSSGIRPPSGHCVQPAPKLSPLLTFLGAPPQTPSSGWTQVTGALCTCDCLRCCQWLNGSLSRRRPLLVTATRSVSCVSLLAPTVVLFSKAALDTHSLHRSMPGFYRRLLLRK